MIIDARDFPANHLLTEVASQQLGSHVYVAQFGEHHGRRLFRLIIDGDISAHSLEGLVTGHVRDHEGTYVLQGIEALTGPMVDQSPRRGAQTSYLRVTFM